MSGLCGLAAALLALAGVPVYSADEMAPLDVRQVRVGGEIGRRIDVTVHNNLLALDLEKDFLAPFAMKKRGEGFVGLGTLIDSAVRLAAYTGDPKVLAVKDLLISRVIALQEPDGYVGLFPESQRMRALWDVHEAGYLVYGLLSDYEYFHARRSLEAAQKLAGYLLAHWQLIPPDWQTRTGVAPYVALTGLERTLLALHRATGDSRYLDFVLRERALPEWNLPIVIGRRPGIEGHVYAYLARSLAQLELYRERPEPQLLAPTGRAMRFLTRENGMAITGGAGQWEIWTGDQDGRGELAETCATAYELRVLDSLLRLRGEPAFGDLMERIIYNTLFAAQSPDGRRIRYFTPTEGPRVYHPADTYCCPCNYRRIIAELPGMIYYRWRAGLAVNLYTPSEATLNVAGDVKLRTRQETAYPSDGAITLRLDPGRPASFPVRLRIPAWTRGASVQVNGQPLGASVVPGTYLEIARLWRKGDNIRLVLPLPFRLVRGRQRQAGRVAVMRGPLVFCLDPSQQQWMASLDAADLGRFTLDPATLELVRTDAVHPGGIACRAGAWKPGFSISEKHDLTLVLNEFPDPAGRATYFRLRDMSAAVDDELLAPSRFPR